MATPKWKKHPVHEGILCRTLTPEDVADERRKEAEELEKEAVKASRRWLRPIPNLQWEEIEAMAEKDACGLGGKICDVISNADSVVHAASGRRYATKTLGLYVQYEHIGGVWDTSDLITVVIYRDPLKPRRLRLTYGRLTPIDAQTRGE